VDQLNLIVVKWGKLYSPEYVVNLFEGAKRYTDRPFQFYVFTDDTEHLPLDRSWHFIKLPDWTVKANGGWWYKMEIFNQQHGIYGRNLYIDLDTVIVDDLFPFWNEITTKDLYICRDFNRQFIKNINKANSSVMGWQNNSMNTLYKNFVIDNKKHMAKFRGDQDFIDAFQPTKIYWQDVWATSWKWECWRGGKKNPTDYKFEELNTIIKPETKILVFHGQPNPPQCDDKRIVDIWEGKIKHY
jgi:hypothetical protein